MKTKAPANVTPALVDQIIARALGMESAARVEFLRQHSAPEIAAIHNRLLGEAKPKTPRPVLERKVLAALDGAAASNAAIEAHEPPRAGDEEPAQPLDEALATSDTGTANAASWDAALPEPGDPAEDDDDEQDEEPGEPDGDDAATGHQDAPDADPPHADADDDNAQPDANGDAPGADGRDGGDGDDRDQEPAPAAAAKGIDERLPEPGTVIIKRDRQGKERCRCTMMEGGQVEYCGKTYTSISAAATVAQRDLGLTAATVNGYLFWQLDKRDAGERKPRAAKPAKDHGPGLKKAWERYAELARAAIAADPAAIREQLGAECNAHNDLVAAALAPDAPATDAAA